VATGLLQEHALDQLAPRITVDLTDLGRRAQQFERLLELVDEQFLGVTMFSPPFVLRFKPPLKPQRAGRSSRLQVRFALFGIGAAGRTLEGAA